MNYAFIHFSKILHDIYKKNTWISLTTILREKVPGGVSGHRLVVYINEKKSYNLIIVHLIKSLYKILAKTKVDNCTDSISRKLSIKLFHS